MSLRDRDPLESGPGAVSPGLEADSWLDSFILGQHVSVLKLRHLVRRYSQYHWPVLVTGESGTGKELVSRAVHQLSPRKSKSPLTVSLGSLPASVAEDAFVGHVHGAFTGANRGREGFFKRANGSTLILDDIDTACPSLQAALLRVIEYGKLIPLGSDREENTDVRVVATSNQPLERIVKEGSFRRDLFYRLNVLSICTTPLRQRMCDLELLVTHFLARDTPSDRPRLEIRSEAMQFLYRHSWPGNIRELQNVVRRIIAGSEDARVSSVTVQAALDLEMNQFNGASSEKVTAETLRFALDEAKGNRRKAARMIGISPTTLYRLLSRP